MIKKISLFFFFFLVSYNTANAWQVDGYNLKEGSTFINTSKVDQTITQSMMGQSMEIKQLITSVEEIKVLKNNGDTFVLSSTNISSTAEASSIQGSQKMSSEGNTPADLGLKVLVGKTYEFTINKYGKVLEITGLEALKDSIRSNVAGTPIAATVEQLVSSFDEKNIRTNIENKFWIYPETPSEQWTTNREISMNGMPVTVASDYLFASDDQIMVNSVLTISGKSVQMGMEVDMALEGTQESMITLDTSNGISTLNESTSNLEGDVAAQGMTIPMKILSITTNTFEQK